MDLAFFMGLATRSLTMLQWVYKATQNGLEGFFLYLFVFVVVLRGSPGRNGRIESVLRVHDVKFQNNQ